MNKIVSLLIMISGVFGLGAWGCLADNWDPVNKRWRGQFHSWNCSNGISREYGAYAGGKNKDEPYNRDKYIGPCSKCVYGGNDKVSTWGKPLRTSDNGCISGKCIYVGDINS